MEMERSPFLPLPEGMVIGQVEIAEAQLTVEVISTQPFARCPSCGSPSDHVHCQYQRTVHDVPSGGRRVVLRLCVRKFFCRVPTCQRKVFTERLPDLVQPWARVSNRLLEELKALGLSASAQVNERLAPQLGMHVKAPTLLRYLRAIPPPAKTSVRVLGIDDFAMKRGNSYGTIVVNIFLLVSVLYVISHLFERRSPVSHVCFEQTQACLQHRSNAARNPQHILSVWFSVRAQRTTPTRCAVCLL